MAVAYAERFATEIRRNVYGRDARKPIADACERIKGHGVQSIRRIYDAAAEQLNLMCSDADEKLDVMKTELDILDDKLEARVSSIMMNPYETWYTYDYYNINFIDVSESPDDKEADVVTDQITVSAEGDDYRIEDYLEGTSVSLISDDDYRWNIPNPIKETHVHHGEDWALEFKRANEN